MFKSEMVHSDICFVRCSDCHHPYWIFYCKARIHSDLALQLAEIPDRGHFHRSLLQVSGLQCHIHNRTHSVHFCFVSSFASTHHHHLLRLCSGFRRRTECSILLFPQHYKSRISRSLKRHRFGEPNSLILGHVNSI